VEEIRLDFGKKICGLLRFINFMPQAPAKPLTQRKRTRKRKRRAAFSSSSSSSDTSESDGEDDEGKRKTAELKTAIPKVAESSSSSESDSETSSSSSEEDNNSKVLKDNAENPQKQTRRELSPSPSPPPADLPSFLPPINANDENKGETKEQELKKKFRQFWMSSVADAFRDDLEELRKVCLSTKVIQHLHYIMNRSKALERHVLPFL